MYNNLVRVINLLNAHEIAYATIDEDTQIRFSLDLPTSKVGNYIVVDEDGIIHMNNFSNMPLDVIEDYILKYKS